MTERKARAGTTADSVEGMTERKARARTTADSVEWNDKKKSKGNSQNDSKNSSRFPGRNGRKKSQGNDLIGVVVSPVSEARPGAPASAIAAVSEARRELLRHFFG